ncbi:cadmium resistance transporter [Streptomyces sp. NPDC014991]|uniref:cadmium resistance transporter n=1 Tax=Streptomyces sp. NPDC014991 TaxID=3364935 RepID=UPI0037017D1B
MSPSGAGRFVGVGVIGQAVGLFAVTNVDDILILSLFFAQGAGQRGAARHVVLGQYLGFAAILAVAVAAALGATFLPGAAVPYLGLLPLALGVRAAWRAWRDRRDGAGDGDDRAKEGGPKALEVAAVTFANGGDNIGVYVPVFATAGVGGMGLYAVVFLVLVGVWCFAGRFFTTRPVIAEALSRWGHILLPLVLIAVGLLILVEGGAFGL